MEGLRGIYRGFGRSWRDCKEFKGVLGDCGGIARNLQGFWGIVEGLQGIYMGFEGLWRDCEEFTGVLRDREGLGGI